MEENDEFTSNCFKNIQNTQSMKLKRLSLKSKQSHHLSNCGLEYKPEAVSLNVVGEGNDAVNKEPVTKDTTQTKKCKKLEVSPVSPSTKHHQNNKNLIDNMQTDISNIEEFDKSSYNEEQKLESDGKNENKLVGHYNSFIERNSAPKYSKDGDNNSASKELGTNISPFPVSGETNVINESVIQNAHELSDDGSDEDSEMSVIITKSESDFTEDYTSQGDVHSRMKRKSECLENAGDTCKSVEKRRYKFSSIKRRAGLLYKQIMNSKLNSVSSEYFLLKKNCSDASKLRWIPPRSPYSLIQEDLFDKPWQLLIATIFLTKVSAKKALPQIHKFLKRWPRPEDLLLANEEDLYEYMKPLGLTVTRSHAIMRFTVEFLEKDWKYPRELYGIGKYGDDSYRMFCINEWRQVRPDDIPLNLYRNWLLENADALGIT